jgi:hypothetical protein
MGDDAQQQSEPSSGDMKPGPARLFALVPVVVLAACGSSSPTSSPTANTRAPTGSALVSSSPEQTHNPTPTLTTGSIDQHFTTPTMDYTSTGTYLIWSSGSRLGATAKVAPDLFGSTPGGNVQVLYANPNRDSQLHPIGGDGSEFAFIEENFRAFGFGGWKLWYIPKPGAEAIEIDHGVMNVIPYFAISGKWLVWTPGTQDKSELRIIDLTTMTRRTLLSSSPRQTQYWYPAIDGNRLVYGTVELASDGQSDERHLYLQNLDVDLKPQRLDQSKSASQPAIVGDDVVWKESDPALSFDVGGGLVHYSLTTAKRETLSLRPGPAPTINGYGAGFLWPSIGRGYVAAWTDSFDGDRVLNLTALEGRGLLSVIDLGPTQEAPHDVVVRPELRGDLLAYVFGPAKGDLQLRWVRLRPTAPVRRASERASRTAIRHASSLVQSADRKSLSDP